MSSFAKILAERVEGYIALRRSLGYTFRKQATTLRALVRYVEARHLDGPLTRKLALGFVMSWDSQWACRPPRRRASLLRVSRYL